MKTFNTKTKTQGLVNEDLFYDLKKYIGKLKDKYIKIDVSVKRKLRSNSQNKLYWVWLGLIAKEATRQDGEKKYTADDFHLAFRKMFLNESVGVIVKIQSTTELDTKEFTKYLDRIQKWVWEHLSSEFIFPLPEDLYT